MLVIFDWDGTLCSSLDRIVLSVQRSCEDAGVEPPSTEQTRSIVGLGLQEAMDELFPAVAAPQRELIRERYRHHFVSLDVEAPSPLYEGALETLQGLKDRGYQLAVATGKSRVGLQRVLDEKQMHHWFDATRCADETRSKPHPQMLHELLDELQRPTDEAVMIGDTEFDLMMANHAGMRAVGLTHGAHPVERLQACNPSVILDRLVDLLDHL